MTEDSHSPREDARTMFRPPLNRAMTVLDRSKFALNLRLAVAIIANPKDISTLKDALRQDTFKADRLKGIHYFPNGAGNPKKGVLLDRRVNEKDASTWSPTLKELVDQAKVELTTTEMKFDYDFWNYDEIMQSIVPEEEYHSLPHGFNSAGHVAHVNFRQEYLPLRHLMAKVILDKNPHIRTVINKIDDVGAENEFRTFKYEVLEGPHDMSVEVSEQHCMFRFDYSKVYWNSKLQTEHTRLTRLFKRGEAIADAMAGVGPFAVPAAKKQCFVWANDLNPDSYTSLEDAIQRNKVSRFVKAFNQDARQFIRQAPQQLYQDNYSVDVTKKVSRHAQLRPSKEFLERPKTFSHFVLNLPATAINFLDSFKGIYADYQLAFAPHTQTKLPLIHVYCFEIILEGEVAAKKEVCKRISHHLGHSITLGECEKVDEASVHDVRDVSPTKHMFCASFRLPHQVAFANA